MSLISAVTNYKCKGHESRKQKYNQTHTDTVHKTARMLVYV
jgi:hypothetical protein